MGSALVGPCQRSGALYSAGNMVKERRKKEEKTDLFSKVATDLSAGKIYLPHWIWSVNSVKNGLPRTKTVSNTQMETWGRCYW